MWLKKSYKAPPRARRSLAAYVKQENAASERQACRILGLNQAGFRDRAQKPDAGEIQAQLRNLAERKPRWGFKKMFAYLRNQPGFGWNHKRVYRVYFELQLNLRVKPQKRLSTREPKPLVQPAAVHQR